MISVKNIKQQKTNQLKDHKQILRKILKLLVLKKLLINKVQL
jgi:hypothetical protein